MTRGVKVRLIAFLLLSAIGVVYVAGSFLGLVDRVLGRGFTIHATLPTSGGLFDGSEVTYRGVKVGKVSKMDVTATGLRVDVALKDQTKIPKDSKIYVHNLSAVGEQYLDFEPAANKGPYAGPGDTIKGSAASLPMSEEQLLTQMDAMVSSVDGTELSTVVSELGQMFRDTANPLQQMVDSGTQFVDEADAHKVETIDLLNTGQTVLRTQAKHEEDIPTFAKGLADLTGTLKNLRPGPAHDPAGWSRHGEGGGLAAPGAGAHHAGVPVQPAHGQPGAHHQHPRTRADAGHLPARDRDRLHRDARRRLRPHQPAVQQQRGSVHQGLRADQQVASGDRHRRTSSTTGARCDSGAAARTCAATKYAPGSDSTGGQGYRVSPYDARTGPWTPATASR